KDKGVPNRHVYARISYLQQASLYLQTQQDAQKPASEILIDNQAQSTSTPYSNEDYGLPRLMASHILQVSRKSVIRLSHEMKRGICKRCTSVLIPGRTSETRIDNKSRGGKRPWADVMVTTCLACGMEKRFPVGAERQTKKKLR
ncbi:RNAse P, Rpr2/Rpp21 subunit, partial [Tothia fuscella]